MAALSRGAAAGTKGGGGGKQVGSRVLFVTVGCFLFFLVFLLSARPDAATVLGARKCCHLRASSLNCRGLAP
jgi:hypothetical protein